MNTNLSDSQVKVLVARLTRFEGRTNHLYFDNAVPPRATIGVGFNLTDVGLFDDEIDYILNRRIERAFDDSTTIAAFHSLDPLRQTVIVEMVFNIGLGKVKGFTKMFAAIAKSDYALAAAEMLESAWAKQVGTRAIVLAKIMKDGVL